MLSHYWISESVFVISGASPVYYHKNNLENKIQNTRFKMFSYTNSSM
jgi:hypothetical protein